MRVMTSPEARSYIRDHGGLLFVWIKARRGMVRGALQMLKTSTEPPANALDWQRIETKGFVLFLPPGLRRPSELHLEVRGWSRRRIDAFWEGCAFVI